MAAYNPHEDDTLSEGTQSVRTWAEQRAEWLREARVSGRPPEGLPPEMNKWFQLAMSQWQRREEEYKRRGLADEESPELSRADPYITELKANEIEVRTKQAANRLLYKGDPAQKGMRFVEEPLTEAQQKSIRRHRGEDKDIQPRTRYEPVTSDEINKQTQHFIQTELFVADPDKERVVPVTDIDDIAQFRKDVLRSYFGMSPRERHLRRAVIDKRVKPEDISPEYIKQIEQESIDFRLRAQRRAAAAANRLSKQAAREKARIHATGEFARAKEKYFGSGPSEVGIGRPPTEERLGGTYIPITTADMLRGKGIKQQAALQKRIAGDKVKALKKGTLTVALDSSGKPIDPASKDAAFRLSPNAQWEYVLRDATSDNPTKTKNRVLPYWDKKPRFERGLEAGKSDQIVHVGEYLNSEYKKVPVLGERLVRRQTAPIAYEAAPRVRKDKKELGKEYSREIFVPIKGVKAHSRDIVDPESYEQRLVRAVSQQTSGAIGPNQGNNTEHGPWREASFHEWALADPNNRQVTKLNKKMRVTYIDPAELEAKRKEKDALAFALPGPDVNPEKLAWLESKGLITPGNASGRILEYRYDPDSRLGATVNPLIEAQREQILRKKSFVAQQQSNRGIFFTSDEAERARRLAAELAGAGATAAYYAQLDRTRKGWLPYRANQVYGKALSKNAGLKEFAEKRALGVEDDKLFAVKEAYLRPTAEKVANTPYMLRHPLSSLDGSTDPGIDFGSFRYRERFFPFGDAREIVPNRKIELEERRLDRLVRTQKMTYENAYKKGIVGKFARSQAGPMMRNKDYKDFYTPGSGYLSHVDQIARDAWTENEKGTPAHRRAAHLATRVETMQANKKIQDALLTAPLHITPSPEGQTQFHWNGGGHIPDRVALVPRTKKGLSLPDFELTPLERNVAIGGAAVATAAGAHYLYYKQQQSKLAPEERVAYYNHIIPGPVKMKVPHLQATAHYRIPPNIITNEFGWTNKTPAVRFHAGLKTKTVWKGAPQDRGYAPNAKLGLKGIKGAGQKPQGSLKEALIYDPELVYNRKRVVKPAGNQVLVKGKKLPLRVQVGKREALKLSPSNPNRLSTAGREDIIWAFHGHPDEQAVKDFFAHGKQDRILDMWEDEDLVNKVRVRRGEQEARKIMSGQYIPDSARLRDDIPADFDGVSPSTLKPLTDEEYLRNRIEASDIAAGRKRGFMGRGHPGDVWNLDRSGTGGRRPKTDEVFDKELQRHISVQRPVGKRKPKPGTFDASAQTKARRYDR